MTFADEFCFPFLLRSRNADGGWGYRPGTTSGVEPTCWALLALARRSNRGHLDLGASDTRRALAQSNAKGPDAVGADPNAVRPYERPPNEPASEDEALKLGRLWLHQAQLPDGSWPPFAGQPQGCWVTALACLALRTHKDSAERVGRGVQWLCNAWPAEGRYWRRLLNRLRRKSAAARQNDALRGWSWTPGTASWVEPTALSLILLKALPGHLLPRSSEKRKRLAEAMLYDRMCLGGGWNAGNSLVYNVALAPRVGPTAWALLALLDRRDREENRMSLDWLAGVYPEIQGPGSLALAHLSLEAYGRRVPENESSKLGNGNSKLEVQNSTSAVDALPAWEPCLRSRHAVNGFLMNVAVAAWVVLALQGMPDWLPQKVKVES